MKNGIIYLIGRAGAGKYTISKEIAKHGYIICDNQLINYTIFTLLNYGGMQRIPQFAWNAIFKVREGIFDFLRQETENNYVVTNVLYNKPSGFRAFYQLEEVAEDRGSYFVPIKILVSEKENMRRIQNPERLLRQKSINPIDVTEKELINIKHQNLLELDATNISASDAAQKILEHISNIMGKNLN